MYKRLCELSTSKPNGPELCGPRKEFTMNVDPLHDIALIVTMGDNPHPSTRISSCSPVIRLTPSLTTTIGTGSSEDARLKGSNVATGPAIMAGNCSSGKWQSKLLRCPANESGMWVDKLGFQAFWGQAVT